MLELMVDSFLVSFKATLPSVWDLEAEEAWRQLFKFIVQGMTSAYHME